jgi:uncharacterized coiled-coil protein SlyX
MQLYSKTLAKLISNIDKELEILEMDIVSKEIEIAELNQTVSDFQTKDYERIEFEQRNMLKYMFSDDIEIDGLGISGARLLNKLRQLDKIDNMNEFLTQFGLNK